MTQAETYDEFMTEFPAVWAHEHSWVNVHDGKAPKLDALLDILNMKAASNLKCNTP